MLVENAVQLGKNYNAQYNVHYSVRWLLSIIPSRIHSLLGLLQPKMYDMNAAAFFKLCIQLEYFFLMIEVLLSDINGRGL